MVFLGFAIFIFLTLSRREIRFCKVVRWHLGLCINQYILFLQLMVYKVSVLSRQLVALEMKYFNPTFIFIHVILGILSFIMADLIQDMINYSAYSSVLICGNRKMV